MQCEKCGQQLADNATFCTSCGWKTTNWKRKVKSAKTMHVGAIVASVLLIAVLVFLLIYILQLTNF